MTGFGSALVKFAFPKKATKIDEIFTVNLTLCSTCQIDGEDFFNFTFLDNMNLNINQFKATCLSKKYEDDASNSGRNKKVYPVNQFINHLPWASNTVT